LIKHLVIIIIIITCVNGAFGPHFMHKIVAVGPLLRLVLTFGEDQTFWHANYGTWY